METTDTTTPVTEAPAVETPAVDAPAVEAVAAETEDEGTVLGGKPETEAAEPAVAVDAPVIPEAYELTAPEGMNLDADLIEAATPVFKEIGLTNEAANKLMPFVGQLIENTIANVEAKMVEGAAAQRKAWLDSAKAADDIGGGKWDATLHSAAKGLDALGFKEGSDFRKLLTETGLGNHPDMIRIAARVGELVGEDGEFATANAGAVVEVSREQRWYGKKE